MRNIQNIIGGEKWVLFSVGRDFLGGYKNGEKRIVFLAEGITSKSIDQYEADDYKSFDEMITEEKSKENLLKKIEEKLNGIKNKITEKNLDDNDLKSLNRYIDTLNDNFKSNLKKLENKNDTKLKFENLDPIEKELENLNNLKTAIENQRKNFTHNKLAFIYGQWRQTETDPSKENFIGFLKEIFDIDSNEELDLNHKSINKNSTNYKKQSDITKKFLTELSNLTSKGFNVIDMKVTDHDINRIIDTGKIYTSIRETNDDGTLNRATDMLKKVDFSTLLESESGIITAGIALTALYKITGGGKGFYGIVGSIASIFGLNTITKGGFLDFLGKERDDVIEEMNNNNYEDHMQDQLNLRSEELPIFKKVVMMKKEDFISDVKIKNDTEGDDENFNRLMEIAKGTKPATETELKKCPKGMDKKYYASVILKIIADQGGYNFVDIDEGKIETEQNTKIDGINKYQFKLGLKNIQKGGSTIFNSLILKDFETGYQKIKGYIEGLTEEGYKKLKETGVLKYLRDQSNDLGELWDATIIFKYNENTKKLQIFSSKENEGQNSLIGEFIDGGFRMLWGSMQNIGYMISDFTTETEYLKAVQDSVYAINNIKDINKLKLKTKGIDGENEKNKKLILQLLGKGMKEKGLLKNDIILKNDNDKNTLIFKNTINDKELNLSEITEDNLKDKIGIFFNKEKNTAELKKEKIRQISTEKK